MKKRISIVLTRFCVVLFLAFTTNVLSQTKPNILFVLVDDLGYGDLSCYGATDLYTPNLDALADRSTLFDRAYANSTVCSPSRAAILTGNYPDWVGVPGVIRDMPQNTWGNLANEVVTLPQALQQLDYHTALIGKWHLGYQSPDLPNDRGFAYFKGFVGDMMDDYYNHKRAGKHWMRENETEIFPKGHATDLFTNWTLDYLTQRADQQQPFFLFLTYNAPHDPIQPPKDWLDKVDEREKNASLKRKKIVAFIEHLDHNIGRVLAHLDQLDLTKNTIVVFTSDNGGALNYGASNAPFRGGKGDLFEGGIRVPCLVAMPNQHQKDNTDQPILLMDFHPTIIQWAGGTADNTLPSKPILAFDNHTSLNEPRHMVWMRREGHKFGGRIYYAISDGRYKLIQKDPFYPYLLFDLHSDPFEHQPLIANDKKRALMNVLTKHIQHSGQIPWQ
ncbi:MAG: sulfatase-like hydrolase/transferase [Flavobacteriaceae bacterium]|nr:sulfatase-like hydrolase/transferase [Flavobacteriaceae bacterium]